MDLTGRFTGKLGGETDFNSVRNAIESVDAFFFKRTEEGGRGRGMSSVLF